MARPYSGNIVRRDKIQTRNILFTIDTSLSMLCNDVTPNRLSVAKSIATRLIDNHPDALIGVMAFAGTPNLITSLSIDHDSIKEAIANLDENSAHIRGSDLTNALLKGIEVLRRSGKQANTLILITDGANEIPEIDKIANLAKQSNVQIIAIGVGTESGGTIPLASGFHRDLHGRVVTTRLQPGALRQLASMTNGLYIQAFENPEHIISSLINSMDQFEITGRKRQIPNELYAWFLAPGIFLLIIATLLKLQFKPKRSRQLTAPALAFLIIFSLTPHTHASESWLQNAKEKLFTHPAESKTGYRALAQKKYNLAIRHLNAARLSSTGDEHAALSFAIAQAYYRLSNFPLAEKNFSQAMITTDHDLQIQAHYNLANATFKSATSALKPPNDIPFQTYLKNAILGGHGVKKISSSELNYIESKLTEAITHYTDVLAKYSNHSAATKNKKIAETLLKTIKLLRKRKPPKQTPPDDNDQKKKDQKKKDSQKKDGQKKDGQKKDGQKKIKQLKPSDKTNSPPLTPAQEKALKLLRKHQDRVIKNPVRSRWQRHPEIDW